jgi:hypothetical protein
MPTIRCEVGRVGSSVVVPPPFDDPESALAVSDAFLVGSRNNIRLKLRLGKLEKPIEPESPETAVSAYDLHVATDALIGHAGTGPGKVDRIAVLLARRYAYPPALGLMFDRGFVEQIGSDLDDTPKRRPDIAGRPREACAIFVDAIADFWPNPGTAYPADPTLL